VSSFAEWTMIRETYWRYSLKRGILISLLVLLLAGYAAADTFDTDMLNLVTFVNYTNNDIEFIFLSPGDSDHWGPEILGAERILEAGDSLGFWILYPDECNEFDIMAIDEDGNTAIIYDYTICDGLEEEIEITKKDMRDDTPDIDFVTVYVENDTIDVWYVFISPSDSEMWGVDYLDETTILEMEDSVGFLFPVTDETTTYDLMAVDEDLDTYSFSFEVDYSTDEDTFLIEISDLD
jgi:hypothetical protein